MKPYYEQDGIRIFHGDALEVMAALAEEPVSFVFADPPYGISAVKPSREIGGSKPFGSIGDSRVIRTHNPRRTVIRTTDYSPVHGDETPETARQAAKMALGLFPKAVHIWWGANYYADTLPPSSCWIVWDKQNSGDFADGEMAWTNQKSPMRIFPHMWNGMLKASERGERRVHPCQKPVRLATFCLTKYGKPNDLILDPFIGSGSTLVAAKQLNRRAIGVELSERYVEIACKRLAQGVLELA